MYHQMLPYRVHLVSLSCLLLLAGCYGLAYLPTAIQAGASIAGAMEFSDVKVALGPGVTPEELKKIKKVGLAFGSSGGQQAAFLEALGGGGLAGVFSDNLAIEMLLLGFEVVEREQLLKVLKEQELQMGGLTETDKVIEAGKILAVDAVITGTVTAGQEFRTGYYGTGSGMKAVVSNATVKVLNVETGSLLLAMAVSYKKGQSPDTASRALAQLLRDKLTNPTGA